MAGLIKCLLLCYKFFSDIFLENNNVPKSMYVIKKIMKVLGLHYEKIHACKNDYILFQKENANLNKYPTCGMSR